MEKHYAKVWVDDKGYPFLKNGQLWLFRNNLQAQETGIQNGEVVQVFHEKEYIATGFYSDTSHIAVRFFSTNPKDILDSSFLKKRIGMALDYRLTIQKDNLENCRFIFGEADLLPGLVVDRYNQYLVTQLSIAGLEFRKELLYPLLIECFQEKGMPIQAIYERNDVQIRKKEGLELYKGFWKENSLDTKLIICENGLKLEVDIENGQKTGYFLDQKANRYFVRQMSHGKKVLDCFCHTGGFSLNAAMGNASHVVAVDVSKTALDQAYKNSCLNHLEDRIEFVQADVFDYLETLKENQFDLIVLDPPAFTKSKRTVDRAYHGYKEINLKAMKFLKNGGYLITCSCSRYMENDLFEKMLREASAEAKVQLKQVQILQQNPDHPVLWTMDESSYLKFYILQII